MAGSPMRRAAILVGLVFLAGVSGGWPVAGSSADSSQASGMFTAWVNGDPQEVLARLQNAGTGREALFNRAVALLELAQPEAAERIFLSLRTGQPDWLPALRGLGRAEQALGRAEVLATATLLLTKRGASSRDFLWAGEVYLSAGRPLEATAALAGAVEREPDLYLGWLALGDALQSMGRSTEATKAWTRAAGLCATADVLMRLAREAVAIENRAEGIRFLREALEAPGGEVYSAEASRLVPDADLRVDPTPHGRAPASTLRPGEVLRYSVRYLSMGLGRVVLSNLGVRDVAGHQAHGLRLSARSRPAIFFYRVRNEYDSAVTDTGAVVRHSNVSDDSTATPSLNTYEMDDDRGVCVWRYAENGLIGIGRMPLPPLAQDGVSVLALAREVARTRRSTSVLTAVGGTWKGTELRVVGIERIRWHTRDVDTVRVDVFARYRGAGGLAGASSTWFSVDGRALPYRSTLKIPVGSAVLELESE